MPPPQLVSLLSLLLVTITAVYNLFFVPSRGDRKEMEREVSKLRLDIASHAISLMAIAQQIEKICDESDRRCKAIESQLLHVGRILEDLAGIKIEIRHVTEGYSKLERKIDQLLDRRGQ